MRDRTTTLRQLLNILGASTIALALCLVAACGHDAGRPAGGAGYAALGDSYSSGAGIAPVVDAGCQRSASDFGALVAKQVRYSSFTDTSCGGATTTNLLHPQDGGGAHNPPQLDAVGRRTRLVTLTLGLNDDGLSYALAFACQSPSGVPSDYCRFLLRASNDADKTLSAVADRLEKSLTMIRRAAPSARIVLVGYPRLYPDSGSCPHRVPMVDRMVPVLRSTMELMNEKWKSAAAAAGADYVDTWSMSAGHDICAADPWINGATAVPGKAAALHPFPAFHRAVAAAIVKLVQTPAGS